MIKIELDQEVPVPFSPQVTYCENLQASYLRCQGQEQGNAAK